VLDAIVVLEMADVVPDRDPLLVWAVGKGGDLVIRDQIHFVGLRIAILPSPLGVSKTIQIVDVGPIEDHRNIVPLFDTGESGRRIGAYRGDDEQNSPKERILHDSCLHFGRTLAIHCDSKDSLQEVHKAIWTSTFQSLIDQPASWSRVLGNLTLDLGHWDWRRVQELEVSEVFIEKNIF
jgi:hypothetical protein